MDLESGNFTTTFCSAITPDSYLVGEGCAYLLLAIGALYANGILLFTLRKTTGYTGPDVRALLVSAEAGSFIKSGCYVFRALYILLMGAYGNQTVALNAWSCALFETPFALASMAMITSMLAIGAQRLRSTFAFEKEDRKKSDASTQATTGNKWKKRNGDESDGQENSVSKCIGCSLGTKCAIIFCWAQPCVIYAALIYVAYEADLMSRPFCYCYFPWLSTFQFGAFLNAYFALQEVAILCVYVAVYVKNRSRLMKFTVYTANHSLNARFRAWTNVRTTRMLLPSAALHACIYVVLLIAGIFLANDFLAKPRLPPLRILVVFHMIYAIDLIGHPLLCICFNERFRTLVSEKFCFCNFATLGRRSKRVHDTKMCEKKNEANADEKMGEKQHGEQMASTTGEEYSRVAMKQINVARRKTVHNSVDTSGKKTIVDFHLDPDVHASILQDIWQTKM